MAEASFARHCLKQWLGVIDVLHQGTCGRTSPPAGTGFTESVLAPDGPAHRRIATLSRHLSDHRPARDPWGSSRCSMNSTPRFAEWGPVRWLNA